MRLLYKFATRSRPEKFRAAIENILSLSRHPDFTILVSADRNDDTMNKWSEEFRHTIFVLGESKNKIDAINRDLEMFGEWDILINMSDDMAFTKEGFDLDIINSFLTVTDGEKTPSALGPNLWDMSWRIHFNLDQFIHFPDGHTQELLASMSIMGRKYYERFGYIYHPDYVSLWCDNEAQEVAKKLGCYKYVNKQIFEHRHPAWVGGLVDDQLKRTQDFERQDRRTYEKRKAAGFPNESVYIT